MENMELEESYLDIQREQYQSYLRFQLDLEFIQMLANPRYLYFLAKNGYFQQEKFRVYLKYLEYFRDPNLIIYIKYPQSLKMLELLNNSEDFVRFIHEPPFIYGLMDQQRLHSNPSKPAEKI